MADLSQKPSLDLVCSAISALYNNPNSEEKERASQWLGDLQKSVFAWTVADELLRHQKDLESCYFAAQTMRSKIQYSFHELPTYAYISLRDSLLAHISQINETTSFVIVTQLCLALADLVLQMPTWDGAVLDLINRFSVTHTWPLLEILNVLPEELESRAVRIGENRRLELLDDLKKSAPTISEFLKHCCSLSSDNVTVNIKIIRCFTSWVSVRAIPFENIHTNIVILKAFDVLAHKGEGEKQSVPGALHDAATDCICTLLQCMDEEHQELEIHLFNNIVTLEVAYHMSVANEDTEKSMNYCRIFTELGETFLKRIIAQGCGETQIYAKKILDLILICIGHHDYEVAEVTFNFWYLLSEELYQINRKDITTFFQPYVERLITALCRHCQMEPDHEGLLENGDDFKDFRLKVSDLVTDVVFIVGSKNCFQQMFMNIQEPGVSWDNTEAALFMMQTVAKNVLPTENEIVPKVVEAILNLPQNAHVAVRHTSVLLLGELSEWIEKHPISLEPILNFLVCYLPQPGVGVAAATALQNICTTCNEHMAHQSPVLIQLMTQVDSFPINNNAVIGLLKGVAAVVSCMPHNQITNSLRQLCSLQLTPLCQLIDSDVVPQKGTTTDPVLWLDGLSSIFRNVNIKLDKTQQNPCRINALEVWPILSRTLDKYQDSMRIIERCCRSIRFMLRCVSQQVPDLLKPVVEQLVRLYAIHRHSCFLYLGSILVDEYATKNECIGGLLEMLNALIGPTFQTLVEEDGLRNHPDTVDDFFRLCTRFIQRAPLAFLECEALPAILQCSLSACNLDHKEANLSVMKFLDDLVAIGQSGINDPDYKKRHDSVSEILMRYGQQLVTNLVHASIFYLHSYMLKEVSDVIIEMLNWDRKRTSEWLSVALESLPKESNGGIITATPEQLKNFHETVSESKTSKSINQALKKLRRLYR